MNVVTVNAKLQWAFRTDHESNEMIAVCEPLGLVTHGRDLADLQSSINESLNLLFRALLKQGELNAFLTQRGWTAQEISVESQADEEPSFHVPWELIAKGQARGQERAIH